MSRFCSAFHRFDARCPRPPRKRGTLVHGAIPYACLGVMTESMERTEELEREVVRLRSLLSRTSEAIFCWEMASPVDVTWPVDRQVEALLDCRLRDCNDAAVRGFGKQCRDEVIGKERKELWGEPNEVIRQIHKQAIASNYETIVAIDFPYPDGSIRTFENSVFCVVEDGHVTTAWGAARDITARKTLEAQLVQAQKVEAVGRLAASVAHDFNNLLTVMVTSLDCALTEGSIDRELIETALIAAQRSADLTRQLLTHTRSRAIRVAPLGVVSCLDELKPVLHRLCNQKAELSFDFPRDDPQVLIDRTSFEQVVLNAVANACDAVPAKGGKIVLSVERRAQQLVLRVDDNGRGLSKDAMEHALEPFFTTKPEGQGTGLGLSTCVRVAQEAGGTFSISNTPTGCRAELVLPEIELLTRPLAPSRQLLSGTGVVLLVDDHREILELFARVLTGAGYRVVSASSAEQAETSFLAEHFDAVVTDVRLGDKHGLDLVRWLRTHRPEIPVLVVSGFGAADLSEFEASSTSFLAKPCPPARLLSELRRLMAAVGRAVGANQREPLREGSG